MKSPAAQSVVQTSTWTRLADGGKFTRTVPVTSTASKKSGSTSVTTSRLSQSVPVFWAASLTWTVWPGRPGCGRTEVAGLIDFCTDAPSLGSVAVMAAEQKSVAGWLSEPTDAQFWIRVPVVDAVAEQHPGGGGVALTRRERIGQPRPGSPRDRSSSAASPAS